MQVIRLERGEWRFDEGQQLGPSGGFGEVFRGEGSDGAVAIKRLKLSAGAASHRELSIGAALADRRHQHIVPILDYGQDAESDRYFLVMPICETSLQDLLEGEGPLALTDLKATALSIIAGLQEVGDIVHRDLKPGNVLLHEGVWKIADFGIAKFVEDATSLQSLRTSLTPAYAAPEQWRGERPTGATDVYALGCILHTAITGRPPFVGDADDVREAHLHTPPTPVSGAEPRLAGLISNMLRKAPASRPSLARCAQVVSQLEQPIASRSREALVAAGNAVSVEEAAAEAARVAQEAAERARQELVKEAVADLHALVGRLFDNIESDAQTARREANAIVLGPAHLIFEVPRYAFNRIPARPDDTYRTGWDIAAHAFLTLRAERGSATPYDPGSYRFQASLVFAKIPDDSEYRWRELSFHEIFTQRSNYDQPFGLNPAERDFHVAISRTVGQHQVAHGPLTIDGEDEGDFQDRWVRLFAKAATRQLAAPNQLPLPSSFFS